MPWLRKGVIFYLKGVWFGNGRIGLIDHGWHNILLNCPIYTGNKNKWDQGTPIPGIVARLDISISPFPGGLDRSIRVDSHRIYPTRRDLEIHHEHPTEYPLLFDPLLAGGPLFVCHSYGFIIVYPIVYAETWRQRFRAGMKVRSFSPHGEY